MESEAQEPSTFKYYSIEKILVKRIKNGTTECLMKWKDFSSKYNTWEPEDHLTESLKTSEYIKQIREIREVRTVWKVQLSRKIKNVRKATKARKAPIARKASIAQKAPIVRKAPTTRKTRTVSEIPAPKGARTLPRVRTVRESEKECRTQDKIKSLADVGKYYVIDRLMARRKRNEKVEYLVSWKGYSPEESTWEPEYSLNRGYFNVTENAVKHIIFK